MTKEQIRQNAEEYADKQYTVFEPCAGERYNVEQAYLAGAESREPEIDYGKKLIRDILISMNGTYFHNLSEDTKELLKEAAFYVGVKIGG